MEQPQSRLGAAAIITNAHGEVLLVHHTYGARNWELPGGGREPGESALDAVVREVHEETKLTVFRSDLVGVYYEPANDSHHFTFQCTVADESQPEPDRLEISECGFWPIAALPRPITDFTARQITDATGSYARPTFHVVGIRRLLE